MDYMDMCDKMMRENAVLAAHRRFVAEVEAAWETRIANEQTGEVHVDFDAGHTIDAALTRLKKEVG